MTEVSVIPTVDEPHGVSFSEDGTYWLIRRDEFYYWGDAGMQALVIRHGLAGTELPVIYDDGPRPKERPSS